MGCSADSQKRGKVYLVGAGPGDPDLLTIRAARILGLADVVLHDSLVSPQIVALASPHARIMNVGKRCGCKNITQEQINDLLVSFASTGKIVVRLKSGDPSVFGRAGEELDALCDAGVEVEIIPGVTASLAAAAKLNVALTDRRHADQLLFISAHRGIGKPKSTWQELADGRTTVVVYMPGGYERVAQDLQDAGFSDSTPCAVVSKVSCPDEEWHRTTIGALRSVAAKPSPSVLIVGETVRNIRPKQFPSQVFPGVPYDEDLKELSGMVPGR